MGDRPKPRAGSELGVATLVFVLILSAEWLAPLSRDLVIPLQFAHGILGCGVILLHAASAGVSAGELGLRVRNLLPATLTFGLVTIAAAGPVLLSRGGDLHSPFPPGDVPSYFAWAFFQQFIAVGGFWLPFRRAAGLETKAPESLGRELSVAGATALVFGAAHAPNLGLMALVTVAEWLWLTLFARWRNLFSLALAHASAAVVVANYLVPSRWLPSMRVGLHYLES